jgi:hypothetical protein
VRIPVLHYIWSQSSRFAEDRFTLLFFALEKLLSSFDATNPEPELLSDTELSRLWKVIRTVLLEIGKSADQIDLILQKRRELQRPPLKYRLRRHLHELGVILDDMDGEEGLGSMIRVRNLLTHEKGEVPVEEIVFETRRLETIVERMLLKLLSWSGKDHTPTHDNWPIRDVEPVKDG